jgi:hypothetical protein
MWHGSKGEVGRLCRKPRHLVVFNDVGPTETSCFDGPERARATPYGRRDGGVPRCPPRRAIPRAIALPSFGPNGICASLNRWMRAAPIDKEHAHPFRRRRRV